MGTFLPRGRRRKASRNTRSVADQPKNIWSPYNAMTTLTARKMMKQGFFRPESGECEEYKHFQKDVKVSEWAFDRIK